MTVNEPEPTACLIEDRNLEELLDAVDERTKIQQVLHNHIGDGFMSLARERYREPSSIERLGRLVYDDRDEVRSSVRVAVEVKGDEDSITMSREFEEDSPRTGDDNGTLRRRKAKGEVSDRVKLETKKTRHADVRNSLLPVPSREVREAIRSFRLAVDQVIELTNTNSRLESTIHARTET